MSDKNDLQRIKSIIPRVAAVHDMSGFGRVSLTECIPVMSAMGIEVCPLPTAVLSTHTYDFKGYSVCDMTDCMPETIEHWRSLGIKFDAIYSGYLCSPRQIEILKSLIEWAKSDGALIVVDPVMGDSELLGTAALYTEHMAEICSGMRSLAAYADVITPNLTETCLLLGEKIPEPGHYTDNKTVRGYLKRLSELGANIIVITGIMGSENDMFAALYDRNSDKYYKIDCGYVNRRFHGTGDIFTSVFTGASLLGGTPLEAACLSAEFVSEAIQKTMEHPEMAVREGVLFEPVLAEFFSREHPKKRYIEI